jgi:hypothetical protein
MILISFDVKWLSDGGQNRQHCGICRLIGKMRISGAERLMEAKNDGFRAREFAQ